VAPARGGSPSRGVEVVEGDAVDGEDVVLEVEIVFEDVADETGKVVVEDEVDGLAEDGQSLSLSLLPGPTQLVCTQNEPIALLSTRRRFAREDQAMESAGPYPIRVLR